MIEYAIMDKDKSSDARLAQEMKKVRWEEYVVHGSVKIHIRAGQLDLVTIERRLKPD